MQLWPGITVRFGSLFLCLVEDDPEDFFLVQEGLAVILPNIEEVRSHRFVVCEHDVVVE